LIKVFREVGRRGGDQRAAVAMVGNQYATSAFTFHFSTRLNLGHSQGQSKSAIFPPPPYTAALLGSHYDNQQLACLPLPPLSVFVDTYFPSPTWKIDSQQGGLDV